MTFTEFLLQNRLWFEILFLLLIFGPSLIIYYKANKLYRISKYRSINYFGLAFLYMGLAWLLRFIFIIVNNVTMVRDSANQTLNLFLFLFLFYTLSLGGFHLTYSIIRKTLDKKCHARSFMPLLHIAALIIGFVETLLLATGRIENPVITFTVQIIVLIFVLIHSYTYRVLGREPLNPYFISILLALIMYIIVFIGELFSSVFPEGELYYSILTSIIFVIVAYEVLHITRKQT